MSFQACEFIMDYLKIRGPVLEERANPPGRTLGGCARERRRGAGALGHYGEQCVKPLRQNTSKNGSGA